MRQIAFNRPPTVRLTTTVNLTHQRDLPDGRIALSFVFEWAEGKGWGPIIRSRGPFAQHKRPVVF